MFEGIIFRVGIIVIAGKLWLRNKLYDIQTNWFGHLLIHPVNTSDNPTQLDSTLQDIGSGSSSDYDFVLI